MAGVLDLSGAQTIILATHLSSENNLDGLQQLQACHPKALYGKLVLRILLTFLPESIEPHNYTSFLAALATASSSLKPDVTIDTTSVKDLSEGAARQKVRKLHLLPLQYAPSSPEKGTPYTADGHERDPLTLFLIHRAYRIDAETGLLPLALQLVEPFVNHSEYIRTWLISTLLPLLRLDYEYYPGNGRAWSLEQFQALNAREGVVTLLPRGDGVGDRQIGRDLGGLVGPWVYGNNRSKRRKITSTGSNGDVSLVEGDASVALVPSWAIVNDWIIQTSKTDFALAVKAFEEWKGPSDVDFGGYENEADTVALMDDDEEQSNEYAQTALKCIISTQETSRAANEGSYRLLVRATEIAGLKKPPDLPSGLSSLPTVHLQSNLIDSSVGDNTIPIKVSDSSIELLYGCVLSCRVLLELDFPMSCQKLMRLHGEGIAQDAEMKRLTERLAQQSRPSQKWSQLRTQVFWLRNWREGKHMADQGSGIFAHVSENVLDTELLKAMLKAGDYNTAVDMFADNSVNSALSKDEVEAVVTNSILNAFDNASNGNRTRGGMKRASDQLKAFVPKFPASSLCRHIDALLKATHSLSFYSLTLQHGVPFQPVSIRVHQDPIALIGKILEQNPRSYTKLDDLLSIGSNLVNAGLPSPPDRIFGDTESFPRNHQERLLNIERRITSLAISEALNENDFGTAYSYIITRLSPQHSRDPSAENSQQVSVDDISWRAAYNTGRSRPTSQTPLSSIQLLQSLTQRLELLSLALILAPAPNLPEILASWRRCDEEMNVLRAQEAEEESAWDESGDTRLSVRNATTVPGAFSGGDSPVLAAKGRAPGKGGYNEEAPMGLFDVARGAARALGKTAFPLRGTNTTINAQTQGQLRDLTESRTSLDSQGSGGVEGRVRKRDMVSNMVTGGLASGIGWVLGAQPTASNEK